MSHPWAQNRAMKNHVIENWGAAGVVIASFGEARLVKVDGRIELRGGTMADRMEALEWISLFMPDEAARIRRDS